MARNKIIYTCALMVAVCNLFSAPAFASSSITAATFIGGGSFAPSANVSINVASTATAYSFVSFHNRGDRFIGANSTDPKFWYTTHDTSTTTTGPSADTTSYSGWNSL